MSDVRRRWRRFGATGFALTLVVAATVLTAPPNRIAPGKWIDVLRVLLRSADEMEAGVTDDHTVPGPAHGLATVGGATQDGITGTLTAAGRAASPYLSVAFGVVRT